MSVIIIGAGGHAKVAADIFRLVGSPVLGYLDDDPAKIGVNLLGYPVLGALQTASAYPDAAFIIGIGANQTRYMLAQRLTASGVRWASAVHPRAVIAESVTVGAGVLIAAQGAINPDTTIGDHVIINTGATVDHDCSIGDYVHVAPGTHLAGGVKVGAGTLIGVGSVITPYVTIGSGVVIGAGSVITKDIPDHVTVVGVPGRTISTNQAWPPAPATISR